MYHIKRFYQVAGLASRTVKKNLTLDQAKKHCANPETSSLTCKGFEGKRRTEACGDWFEGFEEQ